MSVDFNVIKSSVSIVDVCRDYVEYVKQDHEKMWSKCPFHSDDTPSFVVNFAGEYAGRFHCYGCNVDGDVIDFVERIEHCTKPEAALRICEKFAPRLLTDDNGKFKRQINKAKKVADDERNELINAAREVCGAVRQRSEEQADNYKAALDNGTYTIDELYTLLRTEDANGTAEYIERKYHPEYFEEETKRGRGRPSKEQLCRESLDRWLKNNGIIVRRNVLTKSAAINGLENEGLSEDLEESQAPIIIHDKIKFEYSCSLDTVQNLLGVIAGSHEFNPVLDLLSNAPDWDGVDRLSDVYSALHISADDWLSRSLIKKWFIQCISLQFNTKKAPFGAEGVLVLNGAQNTGKTSCIRKLALHELTDGYLTKEFRDGIGVFKEGMMLSDDKDSIAQVTNAWITELGEISGTMNKSDENFLKNFITRFADEYRVPYGRTSTTYPRRASFFGTVNDSEFLVDPTGSRRWWVIPITQRIDLDVLDAMDKIQFWKQIENYSNEDRQSFRLTLDEVEELNKRNTLFEKSPPAVEEIRDIIANADANPGEYKWIPTTISLFKDYYPVLSRYTVGVLGKALKYTQEEDKRIKNPQSVPQDKVKEYGLNSRKGRFITLPYPKNAFIYGSPSEIPPEDRVTLADNALEIAQKGLGQ